MADGHSHPFNNDAVAGDTLTVYHNQSSTNSPQATSYSKTHQHKNLLDILSSNNTSNHFLNSTDPSLCISSQTITDDDFNRLKSLIRSTVWPIDHLIRRRLWMNILTLNRVSTSKQSTHHPTAIAITGPSLTTDQHLNLSSPKSNHWPNFVDTNNLCFYHLNESTGRLRLQRVLFTFALNHPDVTYCPALEPIASLLLHYFTEHEVLYLINRLLNKHWLFGETRLQWEANWNVFRNLLRIYYKSTADTIDMRFTDSKGFYQDWFWWIFRYLPFPYIVKVMDCLFFEGPKILYRVGLALVQLFVKKPSSYNCLSSKDHVDGQSRTMADFCQHIPVTIEQLLRVAFQIRNLKRRTIEHLIGQEEKALHNTRYYSRLDDIDPKNSNNNNNNDSSIHANISDRQSPFVTPQHLTQIPQTSILNHQQFLTLWNWLPARLALSQPVLIFTTEKHGFRLQTLLNKVDEIEYSILIVKANNGEIFGAFCAGLWSDRHNKTYFGFGESFLFKLSPTQIKYSWVGQQQQLAEAEQRQSQVKRELFLFANHEKILVGGGNGDGLCIDASLCEGRTAHCETFNNQPLCSVPYFSISVLEMITFDFSSS